MKRIILVLSGVIDRTNAFVGKAVSWLSLVLVVITVGDVLARYVLRDTAAWVMELEWHIFAVLVLGSAANTLRQDRHVRVDLWYQTMDPRYRRSVDLVGTLFLLLPWCLLLLWVSWPYALSSWQEGEGSPDPGGLPARYIVKFMVMIAFLLLALQGVAVLIKLSAASKPRR